jgi:hypothetical protein
MPAAALLVDVLGVTGGADVVAVDVGVARVHAATSAASGGLASTKAPARLRNPRRSMLVFYRDPEEGLMIEPIALFGIQFTLSLAAYGLIAWWYVAPRLSRLPLDLALAPLLWVHAFRILGGTILAPGSVGPGVPTEFREMIGYGDLTTAVLALLALIALRRQLPLAIALVWVCVTLGMLDTVNAIIQSIRFSVFTYPLGVNWVIVTMYVPALLVSSLLIVLQLIASARRTTMVS